MSEFQQPFGYNKDAPESVPWIPVPRISNWKSVKASFSGLKIETRELAHAILPSWIAPVRIHQYSKATEKAIIRNPNIRRVLDHPIERIKLIFMAENHTHRDAAQLRTSVNIQMSQIVREAGYEPYTISMSAADTGKGARFFYTPKDLSIPFRNDVVPDNAVLLFTDVDYYADMNKWLKLFKPIIMYTLVPETATYHGSDYSFFIENDVVTFKVAGGATYKHKIWDYTGDTIVIEGRHKALLTYHVTQHKIDKDPNRRIITLIPATITAYPHYCYLKYKNGLQRRKFTFNGKNVLYEPIADKISISANGSPHSVELSGISYEAIRSRLANKTSPPVIADIERILSQDKIADPHIKAAVLFKLIDDIKYTPNVLATNTLPTYFQPVGPLITEDGKNPGKAFSNPLTNQPSLFAARSHNADHATIDGRVTKMKNIVKDPPVKYKSYQTEFVELLVPIAGIGSPWSVDQVRRAQNAPTQVARARLAEATLSTKVKNRLASMIKAEAYTATNDPRNITTCAPEHTIMFSSFTLPFKSEVLKKQQWYGPSKTPNQITKRLCKICKNGALLTDYERLDGTMSKFMHDTYRMSIKRWLHQDYRPEYERLHRECFRRHACTSTGLHYDAGDGTRSGSAITTDTNTCGCSFVCYAALRELGYTIKQAWELIGIICGDDGVNDNIGGYSAMMEKVAKDLGLKLVVEVVGKNEPVKYCSRIFVDPLTCNDSFQDPKRTIPKLHLTANKNVTDEQAAVNKAAGYTVTDSMTPIIGDWCSKVQSLTNLTPKNLLREEVLKCTMAWPQSNKDLIRETFCKYMDITGAELQKSIDMIKNVKTIDGFPTVMTINFNNKLKAQVGSEIVGPINCKSDNKIMQPVKVSDKPYTKLKPIVDTNSDSDTDSIKDIVITAQIHNEQPPPPVRPPRRSDTLRSSVALKTVREKVPHSHICKTCKRTYVHQHPLKSLQHSQFDFQCAYGDCKNFYKKHPTDKSNPTGSVVGGLVFIEEDSSECPGTSKLTTPSKSKKPTKDGKTPVASISRPKSDSKPQKRRTTKPKGAKQSNGNPKPSKLPSTK